jgi:hypothetical protein
LVTSKYDFSVTQAFFIFNTPYYVGHAALTFMLNAIPFKRVRPVFTLPKAVDKSIPG